MRFPKISQRDLLFLVGGAVIGYFVPKFFSSETGSGLSAETPEQRAGSGTMDGQAAGVLDKQAGRYNPACDPTGSHTSDGQHTTYYCNAWTSGYLQANPR